MNLVVLQFCSVCRSPVATPAESVNSSDLVHVQDQQNSIARDQLPAQHGIAYTQGRTKNATYIGKRVARKPQIPVEIVSTTQASCQNHGSCPLLLATRRRTIV